MLSRSIDFLLENAGCVIRYRLKKEILKNLSPAEEEALMEEIRMTPLYREALLFRRPSGYIGRGMHSLDHFRGETLHRTPMEDGETAARLLSNYALPKSDELVSGFLDALRNEAVLEKEFSHIPPDAARFKERYTGFNSFNCLMALVYTMRALLGDGDSDEEIRRAQSTALMGFQRILEIESIEDITTLKESKARYNYPLMGTDEYFPNYYSLAFLAHTDSWRTRENVLMLAKAVNRINHIMKPDTNIHVWTGKRFVPYGALARPIRAFHPDVIDIITYRRPLTELSMLGAGDSIDVLKETRENILNAIGSDGILRMNLKKPHNRRYSPKNITYPTPYADVRLEPDYKKKYALECDLTFWAVEIMTLMR